MDSSEDEAEIIPELVENFYFTDEQQELISFTTLGLEFDDNVVPEKCGSSVFLQGTADGGLQKIYKKVVAWKLELDREKPLLFVKSKEGTWIQLVKPRKTYQKVIRSALITTHFLHFVHNYEDCSEKAVWDHVRKVCSMFEVMPSNSDLLREISLIEEVLQRDQKLKNSEILQNIMELRSDKRRLVEEELETQQVPKKSKFLVSDDESNEDIDDMDEDMDDADEADLFDSVCAICDNGGDLLCCEGPCLRSFHPDRKSGSESSCKSLGLSKADVEAMPSFFCLNCKYRHHQCFICGKLGSSDKTLGAEVFPCVSATCGRFYHPTCVSKMLVLENEADVLSKNISDGLPFTCPIHKCFVCKKTEKKDDEDMQFAICRRCPRAYHRKCLPAAITFDETEDEPQRAWEDLIPNRILIYCRKHKIDPDLGTPKRNHIIFPEVQTSDKMPKKCPGELSDTVLERTAVTSKVHASFELTKKTEKQKGKSTRDAAIPKVYMSSELNKNVMKQKEKYATKKDNKSSVIELSKFSVQDSKFKGSSPRKSETDMHQSRKEVPKMTDVVTKFDESEIESSVLSMIKNATVGLNLSDICAKHEVSSTHQLSQAHKNVDKTITQGKVEGAVKAVKAALKRLEDGGSIDDAKAVCEPDMICQIARWKNKLKVYLAPFLHGNRYTSFGRHFTKVEKLQEIVERLHWYVNPGDMIVDFCCGANDFSTLMKEKLEVTGKQCEYKNFDRFQPKNNFNFERRDWMTVDPTELPSGDRLIMGLNPPFGVKGALANKFIAKALQFKPKLIALIVPKEARRLTKEVDGYTLIWEDPVLMSGKSFYMPGSIDVDDNILGQWNTVAPPLFLWSRNEFAEWHKEIAIQRRHIFNVQDDIANTKRNVEEYVNEDPAEAHQSGLKKLKETNSDGELRSKTFKIDARGMKDKGRAEMENHDIQNFTGEREKVKPDREQRVSSETRLDLKKDPDLNQVSFSRMSNTEVRSRDDLAHGSNVGSYALKSDFGRSPYQRHDHGRDSTDHEEYAPALVNTGSSRNVSRNFESDYHYNYQNLHGLHSGNTNYNREAQCNFELDWTRNRMDARNSDWLSVDSQSSTFGGTRSNYLSEPQHPKPTESAIQHYARQLDHQINYGSQDYSKDSKSFSVGSHTMYPHQNTSGWIED